MTVRNSSRISALDPCTSFDWFERLRLNRVERGAPRRVCVHYLVRGDAELRTAKVVRDGVECPSLSPDGRRISFKKRAASAGPVNWHIAVLDLEQGSETLLEERRSVDDQLEWLDDKRVLYAISAGESGSSATTDVWMISADGSGTPERLLPAALSPAVQH